MVFERSFDEGDSRVNRKAPACSKKPLRAQRRWARRGAMGARGAGGCKVEGPGKCAEKDAGYARIKNGFKERKGV